MITEPGLVTSMSQLNIDPEEIAKFSEGHWWDPQGEFKTLHDINPLRLDYIQKRTPLQGKKIIDIGCGGGLLSEGMAALGGTVTGIDMNEAVLKIAKLHLHESHLKVNYIHSTAEQMAEQHAAEFDVVTCLEMLEHVPNPLSVIEASSKLVKPGGDVFFSTLNRNLKSYLFSIIGAEYLLKLLPKNTHNFSKFIRPSELSAWARKANLSLVHLTGIRYHLSNKTFSLTDDVSVNYLAHFKKD